MINSEEYLRQAFLEEHLARKRYLALARQAREEGLPEIATLFLDAARGGRAHLMTLFPGNRES
ncbi:MAG: ferritin family protein [Desulfobaccales bacterium]